MNWRKFKTLSAVEKAEKVEKPPVFQEAPPFSTLVTFFPCNGDLKNTAPLDPFRLVGERLAEIDRQGRLWTGFMQTLTPADRQQLREAEAAIDRAVLENDCDATVKALDNYQRLLAALRYRLH